MLKAELRQRGAKIYGRKYERVQRLEAYDRNFNFKDPSQMDVETGSYCMQLPDLKLYKDINQLTKIPVIDEPTVNAYLAQFDKKLNERAINLYEERFLLSARAVFQDNRVFVRARCFAEMKKSITYNVDIIICQRGIVLEAQCECGAGLGPNAHCKHVICILYGLIEFSKVGDLIVHETCTEQLQTFNKCKRYKGSPLKLKDVKLRKSHSLGRSISAMAAFDPRPQQLRNTVAYKSYFQNLCIGQSCAKSMPITHLFPPANLYALNMDHDYDILTPEDTFLKNNHLSTISEEVQKLIEKTTIGQSTVTS